MKDCNEKQTKLRSGKKRIPMGMWHMYINRIMFCFHKSNFACTITLISTVLTILKRKHLLNTQWAIKHFNSNWRVPAVTPSYRQPYPMLSCGLLPRLERNWTHPDSFLILPREERLLTHEITALNLTTSNRSLTTWQIIRHHPFPKGINPSRCSLLLPSHKIEPLIKIHSWLYQ